MNATVYNEFAPPPMGGFGRSLSFALFMHLLLLAALTWGIHWKTEPNTLSASAELWSAVPAEAAPPAIEPEPTPPEPVKPPEPVQKTAPQPEPKPTPAPPKVSAAAEREAADIALKKEKEKKKLEEKKAADLEKKKKLEKEKLEKEKLDKEKAKEKEKEKAKELEKKKKKEEALKKEEAAAKAKEDAKKAAAEEKRAAALRSENLKRMQGMAGATGDENAKGTALKSSGPSASYAGRIRARIKPNITFTDDVAGNPKAEVEVKTSPDGTILSRKLLSSSGNKAWDEAVLKAIDKTAVLPRDEDGRVPPVLEISFRPKD
jgi:colicin import membrane protein